MKAAADFTATVEPLADGRYLIRVTPPDLRKPDRGNGAMPPPPSPLPHLIWLTVREVKRLARSARTTPDQAVDEYARELLVRYRARAARDAELRARTWTVRP